MPSKTSSKTKKSTAAKSKRPPAPRSDRPIAEQVEEALTWLRKNSSKSTRDGMARYGIPSSGALGVTVADIRVLGKRLGRNHELALALWPTEIYEARMLTSFVADPTVLTAAQMESWCRDFDSWAICDTLCFHLFDRTPHAWKKIHTWSTRRAEFEKRAAFALLASMGVHDKKSPDAPFLEGLVLIQRSAADERNFVKKSVNWALRTVGKRNQALNHAAVMVAKRLSESENVSERWVGKDALRELSSPSVQKRLSARGRAAAESQSSERRT